jgi:hypothetical protein
LTPGKLNKKGGANFVAIWGRYIYSFFWQTDTYIVDWAFSGSCMHASIELEVSGASAHSTVKFKLVLVINMCTVWLLSLFCTNFIKNFFGSKEHHFLELTKISLTNHSCTICATCL